MSVTINVNGLSLAHKGSAGTAMATVPDVCKTPSPSGPVPMPYPNIATSSSLARGTTTVSVDGGNMVAHAASELAMSTGDEAGTLGGVTSGVNMKEATWLSCSFDVKFEGQGACRLTDKLLMNHANTMCCAGFVQKFLSGPKGPSECAALLERIKDIVGENVNGKVNGIRGLWERFIQQRTGARGPSEPFDRGPNPGNGFPNGSNSWLRHDQEIKTQQESLREHLKAYDDHCGGGGGPPVPQTAREWVAKTRPKPEEWVGPEPVAERSGFDLEKAGWVALGVLAGAGAVVLVFCPFDGPVGEVALGTAAAGAFGMAFGGGTEGAGTL